MIQTNNSISYSCSHVHVPLILKLTRPGYVYTPRPQADLLEKIKTDGLVLDYLYASRLGLVFEELPGLALASWRFAAICYSPAGFRLKSRNEIQLVIQLLLSAIMAGFQLCNIKDYIRLAGEQNALQRKVEQAVQGSSTDLDTFAGVEAEEITTVLRLREVLGDSLTLLAREVAGDLMLLRFVRSCHLFAGAGEKGGAATEGDHHRAVVSTAGATVTASLARREKVGADAVRERILRDDMVRANSHTAVHYKFCPHALVLSCWLLMIIALVSAVCACAELRHRAGRRGASARLATQHGSRSSGGREHDSARVVGSRGFGGDSAQLGDE